MTNPIKRRGFFGLIAKLTAAAAVPTSGVASVNPVPVKPTVVKPEQLYILETSTAGYRHYQTSDLLQRIQPNHSLKMKRQPDNRHDSNAIELYWRNHKIGYVPKVNNRALATLMDEGKTVRVKVLNVEEHPYQPIRFGVWVVMDV